MQIKKFLVLINRKKLLPNPTLPDKSYEAPVGFPIILIYLMKGVKLNKLFLSVNKWVWRCCSIIISSSCSLTGIICLTILRMHPFSSKHLRCQPLVSKLIVNLRVFCLNLRFSKIINVDICSGFRCLEGL